MQEEPLYKERGNLIKDRPVVKKFDKKRLILSRLKRKALKHVYLLRLALFLAILGIFYLLVLVLGRAFQKTSIGIYAGLARDFVTTPSDKIKSFEGRTNILLLGKSGEGHEAPELTDTIIFASIDHNDRSIKLISLPRDIWVTDLRTKLNSIYYWGNKKQEGGGIVLAKATVEEIVGQPVHYAVVLDFSGFKKIVDILDGIDVEVERSFVDERYPIPGREDDLCGGDPKYKCRYETIRFEKGLRHMDGETALKFVRSRNAEGDEGTDFARAARQQKVISAIQKRILSKDILFSPKKLLVIKEAVLVSTETDITAPTAAIIARRLLQSNESVDSFVLPEDFLLNPPKSPLYDNLYVFVPKDNDWGEIHEWIGNILKKTNKKNLTD